MTFSRGLGWGGLALRWALLLFLVFDQTATPFQGYRHDADMGGNELVQVRPGDARVVIGLACVPTFTSTGVQPSAPAQAHMALFVAAASDEEDRAHWLYAPPVLISLWFDWSAWPDATASVNHILSVDLPPPRIRAVSAPPLTRAPPLHA